MFKNTFTIVIRLINRNKGFSFIKLGGLALGLAACLLISLFIREELSFDRFHSKGDRIYRLGGGTVGWPYGKILESEYPEVDSVVYMRTYPTYPIQQNNQRIYEKMFYADAQFFNVFDFPLLEGDPASALLPPYSIVLSDKLATKLFGNSSALGQTLTLGDSISCKVSGIVRIPAESHIQFDALLSFDTLRSESPEMYEEEMTSGWLDLNVINYVLLNPGTDVDQFAAKIKDLPRKHAAEYLDRWGAKYTLRLESMQDIYLYSKLGNLLGPKSDVSYIYLLFFVGLFLLVIAGANFVNLSTARSLSRAKEVGIRKVVGSSQSALIRQFLGESFMTCLLAVFAAAGLAVVLLPLFNDLAATSYTTGDLFTAQTGLVMIGLVFLMSFLAGIYPAFSLSTFRPIEVLRGCFATGKRGLRLRQGLIVTQFVISSVLIVGTLVVLSQLRFMQKQSLGFDSEQVIVLDARRGPYEAMKLRNEVFLEDLASHTSVDRATSMGAVPGRSGWRGQISFPEGWPKDKSLSLEYVSADYEFDKTLGLNLIAGRTLDSSFPTDAETAVLINEAAVKAVGWESPEESIGKRFASPGSGKPDGIVIGVLEDYHHHGLKEEIKPMMFGFRKPNSYYALRIKGEHTAAAVKHVETVWNRYFNGFPMSVFFLDEDFGRQYAQEMRLMKIFSTFSLFTILIACLGLFGLTAYTASQRAKEISVRKVLGASVLDIIKLLSFDFMKLVLIAFIAAAPVGYVLMNQWLKNFAYRPSIGLDIFILNAFLLFSIAFGAMSYQAIKTALAEPVQGMRHE
ncbi:ABC transporter permease [Acidobacteriota bacterium]